MAFLGGDSGEVPFNLISEWWSGARQRHGGDKESANAEAPETKRSLECGRI